MKNGTRSANEREVHCPGCRKRLRAQDVDAMREKVKRHIRNCPVIRPAMGREPEAEPVPDFVNAAPVLPDLEPRFAPGEALHALQNIAAAKRAGVELVPPVVELPERSAG